MIRNSPSHDMLARVGGVPWDSLLSFPMDWEAGLKCAQVEIIIIVIIIIIIIIIIMYWEAGLKHAQVERLSSDFEIFHKSIEGCYAQESPESHLCLVWSLSFGQNDFIELQCNGSMHLMMRRKQIHISAKHFQALKNLKNQNNSRL